MNSYIYKRAFSLTELMIVMVILSILMAAMAPVFTKRHATSAPTTDSVWYYVNGKEDAYYDSGVKHLSSTAYIGIQPSKLPASEKSNPSSKVVIMANKDQNHIQFRYGNVGGGVPTGIFAVDDENSMYMGSKPSAKLKRYTSAGVGASAKSHSSTHDTIAIGANALGSGDKGLDEFTVAVGANAGQKIASNDVPDGAEHDVIVGANSGNLRYASQNVIVGSNIMNYDGHSALLSVLVGADVATSNVQFSQYYRSVILGSPFYKFGSPEGAKLMYENTILGYNTLNDPSLLATGVNKLTAAGNNACNAINLSGNSNVVTCIGAETASDKDSGGGGGRNVEEQIYIGGPSRTGVGIAALEVYNGEGVSAPTVVMNSHLVVRGNFYYRNSSGQLAPHHYVGINTSSFPTNSGSGFELAYFDPSDRGESPTLGSEIIGEFLNLNLSSVFNEGTNNTYFLHFKDNMYQDNYFTFGKPTMGPYENYYRISDFDTFSAMSTKGEDGEDSCSVLGPGYYPTGADGCPNLNFSDLRLKDIDSENTDSIQKLLQVVPYHYTFKSDKTKRAQVGVIAQDLQKYFTNSVSEGKDGYLRIRWDEMFFALINSIKELGVKLANFTRQIDNLEQDAESLASEQKLVQKRIDKLNKRLEKLENN